MSFKANLERIGGLIIMCYQKKKVQAVANIPISKRGGADSIVWGLHSSGKYTVKRGYHKAWSDYIDSKPERPSTSNVPGPSFWNFLWNLKIPPKLKHFWWRDWLPRRIRDLKRGWVGIILRDNRGHLVDGRRFRISSTLAFLAEASVLREACLFAKILNLSSVCIENDNA
ncbi:hypothetical protein RHMOL_Rhmol10G0083000 [Rhododendron molle]|uniref:Uncharacterized protein n=1 Tax=Rhododendron molle TaxID=49168 RepID=A0ACC0M183_RHOML|nr:hypothetical protein RHMOL_Rhmol10G0083000 [Rhododendron molle]